MLGYGPMDDTHHEFVERVQTLLNATESAFLPALKHFAEHLEQHFEQEKQWMISTAFPATDCHVDEHAAVMKSTREVIAQLSQDGLVERCRPLVAELVRWFPGHADYLDAPLAQWMAKRAYGGTPVVLRRNLKFATDTEIG